MKISQTEKILIGFSFLLLWAILAAYAGGPVYSDEYLYIDAGLRRFAEPSYGNRYFHIYLQKLFMDFAPTPLWGVRVFWGFLISLTAAQIYFHARTLTKFSHIFQGLLALAFFFSFPLITEYSGEPAVDITAMAMVTIYISVYLYVLNNPAQKRYALIALGALVFICFKTKETTIFINLLLLGLAMDGEGHWSWKQILELIRPLLIGLAAGIGLFILLDGLILGKPFFAISPATFGAIFQNYDFQPGFYFGPTSWYKVYFLDDLLLPFILFILSGIKMKDELGPRRKLLWLFPLVMAAFVSWNMLKVTFGFIERFYFPALPVIAILAPQALRMQWPQKRNQWVVFGLILVFAGALILVLRSALMAYSDSLNFDFARFLDSIYYPILLSILLAALIWKDRFHWAASAIPLFCVGAMLLSPLLNTQKYFFRYPKVRERYSQLMSPYEQFQQELDLKESDLLLVSAALDRDLEMLSEDPNDIIGMYNFFFDRRITEKNVIMGYSLSGTEKSLAERDITQALVTSGEWESLVKNSFINARFSALPDLDGQFYLLKVK